MKNKPQYNFVNLLGFSLAISFFWGISVFIIIAFFNISSGAYVGGAVGGLTGLTVPILIYILNKKGHDKFLLKDATDKDV